MNNSLVEIIKPRVHVDLNSYWAMHFCSIFETLYEHNTMQHGFRRDYMNNAEPTPRNLAARAGFGFFQQIQGTLQNFGLQVLLCHYLTSDEGSPLALNIISEISDLYQHDFVSSTKEYGVFVSGKDFHSGVRFLEEHNPTLLGYDRLLQEEAAQKVYYADLCILLKGNERNYGLLGEVEGNYGNRLFVNSFWEKKQGEYYSFGIGVRKRSHKHMKPSYVTGEWVKTSYGYKYIIIIDSDNDIVKDFYDAVGTVSMLMTWGPEQRFNYDPSLRPILNIIKQGWDSHIIDLIANLRKFLISNKSATLGTNPLPARVVPSIIT